MTTTYTPKKFDLPEIKGISKKQLDVHLALYEGYVKHTNLILEKIEQLHGEDAEKNMFVMQELRRRLGFEFDGMRTHEYYFSQLEGGAVVPNEKSPFTEAVQEKYGSWEKFIQHVKEVCGTRGIGWTIVYYDPMARTLHTAWVMEHMNGQFAALPIMFAIDMWEHSYMVDYVPAEKNSYVEAFLAATNWEVVEKRFLGEIV